MDCYANKRSCSVYNEVEEIMEWDKWVERIPAIPVKPDWLVTPLPPSNGAIVRFKVGNTKNSNKVSVYLDCYNILGYFGAPYWEVFPDIDGDAARFAMNSVERLSERINIILNAE